MTGKIWAGSPVYVPANGKSFQGPETGTFGRVAATAEAEATTISVTTKANGTLRYPREVVRPAQP